MVIKQVGLLYKGRKLYDMISLTSYTQAFKFIVKNILVAGFLREDGTRRDVDRVFYLMMTVIDENSSHYIQDNVNTYVTGSVYQGQS